MNTEEFQQMLNALQNEFLHGRVEVKVGDKWTIAAHGTDAVYLTRNEYRIKSTPREVWLESDDVSNLLSGTGRSRIGAATALFEGFSNPGKWRLFREVLPE